MIPTTNLSAGPGEAHLAFEQRQRRAWHHPVVSVGRWRLTVIMTGTVHRPTKLALPERRLPNDRRQFVHSELRRSRVPRSG